MDNRQQLLSQYVYPGLGEDAASSESAPRSPYPHDAYPELAELRAKLSTEVAAAARAEVRRPSASTREPRLRRSRPPPGSS